MFQIPMASGDNLASARLRVFGGSIPEHASYRKLINRTDPMAALISWYDLALCSERMPELRPTFASLRYRTRLMTPLLALSIKFSAASLTLNYSLYESNVALVSYRVVLRAAIGTRATSALFVLPGLTLDAFVVPHFQLGPRLTPVSGVMGELSLSVALFPPTVQCTVVPITDVLQHALYTRVSIV